MVLRLIFAAMVGIVLQINRAGPDDQSLILIGDQNGT
jgi:hypothetical protein